MRGRVAVLLLLLTWTGTLLQIAAGDEAIVFPDKAADKYGTSPPQPKGSSSNHGDSEAKDGAKPRFSYDTDGRSTKFNFGVQPSGGGISGSASFSSSYGGHGQAQGHTASQSHSFNFQAGSNGFSASQAASQSSSFNSQFPDYYGSGGLSVSGSQASSQASSVSGGVNGGGSGSAASSQASSFGFQGSGANVGASSSSAGSQSFSAPLGNPVGGNVYRPAAGVSGSNSHTAGASFGGFGGFPNENLSPDFIRYFQRGNKRRNNSDRRKRPGWYNRSFVFNKKSAIVFPE
ncbi:hypothetical protein B7P43_G08991 [Cryptotermes secundus]|uniref:Uncharacterized protein n=1 Tax=Cryptotermes secundus TaxID=105785 RepID=A0A2J7PQ54_9NEOP|nr:keratin, type I cytoskeletal 9 [Cryptotermes secundus]PNF18461.1 hypothetical protein B7P43_G08991 [Cryptotermes secundus]